MDLPVTRFVAVGDADVAYQVIGDGPLDLLYCFGLGSHLEVAWEVPRNVEFLSRLAAFSRLIFFDRRGTGASDGVSSSTMPTWEEWTEDIAAVLDAAGSKRTAILATLEAGPIAILYAAMHPEAVGALILLNTSARYVEADDYPIGVSFETLDAMLRLIASAWGSLELARLIVPSMADDAETMRLVVQDGTLLSDSAWRRGSVRLHAAQFRCAPCTTLIQAPTLVVQLVRMVSFRSHMVVTWPITSTERPSSSFPAGTRNEPGGGDRSRRVPHGRTPRRRSRAHPDHGALHRHRRLYSTGSIAGRPAVALDPRHPRQSGPRASAALSWERDQHHRRRVRGLLRRSGSGHSLCPGDRRSHREAGCRLRVGLHTGECEVRGDDLGGLAVHIAARVAALAGPGEVLVSGTVKDLVVGSGIEFLERGEHELKGVPGTWKLFAVGV